MASVCKSTAPINGSAKSPKLAQAPAPHYRRSTVTRAPRKRSFVANMEKYVVARATPVDHNLVAQGLADQYNVCCDGGNNGCIGGGSGFTGGNGGNGGMGGDSFGSSAFGGDGNQDGITAICVVLGLSLAAMVQRIPFNTGAMVNKANSSSWASVTLCSN